MLGVCKRKLGLGKKCHWRLSNKLTNIYFSMPNKKGSHKKEWINYFRQICESGVGESLYTLFFNRQLRNLGGPKVDYFSGLNRSEKLTNFLKS